MPRSAYYRAEAERALAAAENSSNPEVVWRWLRIAKDYRALAAAMAAEEAKTLPAVPTEQHSQQVQQPQAKLGSDEPAKGE
jgi:hypothetical protein